MNPYNPNIPADNCASNQESSYLYQPHHSIANHNVLQYNNQSAATFNNNRGRPISCSYQPVSDLSYEKKDHVVPPMTLQSDIPLQFPQTNSLTNTAFQSKINSQFNSHWLNPCSSSDYLCFQGQHGTLSHSVPTSIHCSSILCSSNYGNPEHAFLQGQIPVFNSSNFYGCHSNHYNTGQYPSVVSSGQSFIHEPQQHDYAPQCEINDPSVKRKGETSSEVLLLKSIDVNACNIYMMKGSTKQYFKLGKIFGMNGEVKYQREKQFTIQTENDDYLVYRDDIIKKVYENNTNRKLLHKELFFPSSYSIYYKNNYNQRSAQGHRRAHRSLSGAEIQQGRSTGP